MPQIAMSGCQLVSGTESLDTVDTYELLSFGTGLYGLVAGAEPMSITASRFRFPFIELYTVSPPM